MSGKMNQDGRKDIKELSEPYENIFGAGSNTQSMLCTDCETHNTMYSPASEHVSIMLEPCPRIDYQKSFYDCIKCNHRNIFYWHKRHREDRVLHSM
jgi:ribosomal protein S27E